MYPHTWMSHINGACLTSCHTYEWVTSHVYEWVVSHIQMSHNTPKNDSCHKHMNESRHTYKQQLPNVSMGRIRVNITNIYARQYSAYRWVASRIHESCHTNNPVVSQIFMSHVTLMDETCHTHSWNMPHISKKHVTWNMSYTFMNASWISVIHLWMLNHDSACETCHTSWWITLIHVKSHTFINHTDMFDMPHISMKHVMWNMSCTFMNASWISVSW